MPESLFTPATDIAEDDSQCVSAWATPKAGKTTFYLGNERAGMASWPLPLYVINHDLSVKELLHKTTAEVRQNTHIISISYKSALPSAAEAEQLLRKTERAAEEAIAAIHQSGRGTVVVDTATQHWQLIQAAMEDLLDEANPKAVRLAYGPMNVRFRNFANLFKEAEVNAVLIHHAKEVYDARGQATGTYVQLDNKQVDAIVQTKIHLWAREQLTDGGSSVQHGGTIQFCRFNDDLRGLSLPNLDYRQLYELTFGREAPAS